MDFHPVKVPDNWESRYWYGGKVVACFYQGMSEEEFVLQAENSDLWNLLANDDDIIESKFDWNRGKNG